MRGQWHTWDPKITTPPGLYVVTFISLKLQGLFTSEANVSGSMYRATNVIASLGLLWVVWELVWHFAKEGDEGMKRGLDRSRDQVEGEGRVEWGELTHHVVNTLLFPPLFFFYGLYYTDILSVLSVLLTYLSHVKNKQRCVIVAGLASLAFRQTNVFWVAIYLGAMQVQRMLPRYRYDDISPAQVSVWDIIERSWKGGFVYDPFVSEADFEGMKSLGWCSWVLTMG